jgi:hypothetical protein
VADQGAQATVSASVRAAATGALWLSGALPPQAANTPLSSPISRVFVFRLFILSPLFLWSVDAKARMRPAKLVVKWFQSLVRMDRPVRGQTRMKQADAPMRRQATSAIPIKYPLSVVLLKK